MGQWSYKSLRGQIKLKSANKVIIKLNGLMKFKISNKDKNGLMKLWKNVLMKFKLGKWNL